MKKFIKISMFIATLMSLGLFGSLAMSQTLANNFDADSVVENLGIPSAPYYLSTTGHHYQNYNIYPRNIWSMIAFNGVLYLGNGNSSNNQPSPNAGPAPILSYDPVTGITTNEFNTSDEQIDTFKVINGELVIPGNDPIGSWNLGNFYRLRNGSWIFNRTIPNAIHNFDMLAIDSNLYASVGANDGGAIMESSDDGMTWTELEIPFTGRAYSLINFQNNLYASADNTGCPRGYYLHQLIGSTYTTLTTSSVPGLAHNCPKSTGKFLRNVIFNNELVYIMATAYNDIQSSPYGLYAAPTISTPVSISLNAGEIPYDITVSGSNLFVLTGTPNISGGYTVNVRATSDTVAWPIVFYFTAPTLPRSFAVLNNDFYIGLGADAGSQLDTAIISPATGTLLRLKGIYVGMPSS